MRQREKGGGEHQIIFNATWCTREQVEGKGLYTFVQIDSALLRYSRISTNDSRIKRYLDWLYNLIGPKLSTLSIEPTITLNLAKGFYEKGTDTQQPLGWHFTVNEKMLTVNGKTLFDAESSKTVKVEFTPKDIVCLPTIYSKNDTLENKLKDEYFQKLHISDDNTWVQLAQIGLGGDIKVFSTPENNILAEKIYIPGQFGNPHITLCSLQAKKTVLDDILKLGKQQALENNLRKSDKKPLFENIQRVGNTFLPELNAHMQAKATIEHPQLYVLIGPPAVGKSTWIKNTPHLQSYTVISHDDIVDRCIAQYNSQTSDERKLVYSDYRKVPSASEAVGTVDPKYGTVIEVGVKKRKMYEIINELKENVNQAFDSTWETAYKKNDNVIIDMVNMDNFAREKWIRRFSHYYKTAVDFEFDIDQILINAHEREINTGKSIPDSSIKYIASLYQEPTKDEGFDNILKIPAFNAVTN